MTMTVNSRASARKSAIGGALLLAVTATFLQVPPAFAAESDADAAETALSVVSSVIESETGLDPLAEAVGGTQVGTELAASIGGAEVIVDLSDAAATITTTEELAELTVSIDDARTDGEVSTEGFAVYDVGDDAATIVLPQDEGGVQMLNVLESAVAPEALVYTLDLPDGVQPRLDAETGFIAFLDADEGLHGGIAPAWAVDAEGRSVPTRFELDGNQVTQIVEHAAGDFIYPVTADPYMGQNLFSYVKLNSTKIIVSMRLSAFGVGVYLRGAPSTLVIPANPLAGQVILNTYGWKEMLSRIVPSQRGYFNSTSVNQQYQCHALGWISDVSGGWEWNLERNRPALSGHWLTRVLHHRCNWDNPAGGRV